MKTSKRSILYLITLIILESLLIAGFLLSMSRTLDDYYASRLSQLHKEIESILYIQKDISKIFYDYLILDTKTMGLIAKAVDADLVSRQAYREQIQRRLRPLYEKMKTFHVRQLHFHTKESDSLLRMHKPQKHDDSLLGTRYSVEQVNKTGQAIHGFEEGRIYNGFRNVYPLLFEGREIGSVEISFAFEAIQSQLEQVFKSHYRFLVDKHVADLKLFEDMRSEHYVLSVISDDFYSEQKLLARTVLHDGDFAPVIERIDKRLSDDISGQLHSFRSFYRIVGIGTDRYLVRFIPLHNIKGGNVAYIISYAKDSPPVHLLEYISDFILINLLLAIVLLLNKYWKGARENEFIQEILDTQDHIVVVTNGHKIKMVNEVFLEFFGVSDLETFIKDSGCICDRFLAHEAFFHLGKVPEGRAWMDVLTEIDESSRIVTMLRPDTHQIKVFSVFIRPLRSVPDSVLTFTDITKLSHESSLNAYKAMHDELTDIANRANLNSQIGSELQDIRGRDKSSGIVMFDIDHFKKINDTYGHLAGDYVLVTLTKEISNLLRRTNDTFGRWGGEEFIIILPNVQAERLRLIAEKIRIRVENIQFSDIGTVTCSFGATLIRRDDSLASLMERLDRLMYEAKESGRNKVVID